MVGGGSSHPLIEGMKHKNNLKITLTSNLYTVYIDSSNTRLHNIACCFVIKLSSSFFVKVPQETRTSFKFNIFLKISLQSIRSQIKLLTSTGCHAILPTDGNKVDTVAARNDAACQTSHGSPGLRRVHRPSMCSSKFWEVCNTSAGFSCRSYSNKA